ncbi:hypothetical protein ABW20_dc0108224 [Dactylellina cionopaga]|nr:hypothetical protein ABW20_dc0108224 [Dactylellina cionopaga]
MASQASSSQAASSQSSEPPGKEKYLEPADEQAARHVPAFIQFGKTKYRSSHKGKCVLSSLDEWPKFNEDTVQYISEIPHKSESKFNTIRKKFTKDAKKSGLSSISAHRVDNPQLFSVGSEDGVRGKIVQAVYEPVMNIIQEGCKHKIFPRSMGNLRFGDPHQLTFRGVEIPYPTPYWDASWVINYRFALQVKSKRLGPTNTSQQCVRSKMVTQVIE